MKGTWGWAGMDSAPKRKQRASYAQSITTEEAIARGLVKVEKVPPAYVAPVLGADPLPQFQPEANNKFWLAAQTRRNSARVDKIRRSSFGSGWQGKIVKHLEAARVPLTVTQIADGIARRDRYGSDWVKWAMTALCRQALVRRVGERKPYQYEWIAGRS